METDYKIIPMPLNGQCDPNEGALKAARFAADALSKEGFQIDGVRGVLYSPLDFGGQAVVRADIIAEYAGERAQLYWESQLMPLSEGDAYFDAPMIEIVGEELVLAAKDRLPKSTGLKDG